MTQRQEIANFIAMEKYAIDRAAKQLIQKYGRKALPKVVNVVKYYLEAGDDSNAKRWISIGYAVKRIDKIETIEETLKALEPEELAENL